MSTVTPKRLNQILHEMGNDDTVSRALLAVERSGNDIVRFLIRDGFSEDEAIAVLHAAMQGVRNSFANKR